MHEYPSQVELHLKPYIHIGTIDGGAPPQCESTIGDLVETTALCIGKLFKPVVCMWWCIWSGVYGVVWVWVWVWVWVGME